MNIFIVEDDKLLTLLTCRMVERMGYEVSGTAATADEAVECIMEKKPDLILMDIMLEDNSDGIEAMERLRANGLHTGVIFITGNSDAYHRNRAQSVSYFSYLTKPVSYEELESNIKSYFSQD